MPVATNAEPGHVVMVPMSAFGHIIPTLEFAKRLSSKYRVSYVLDNVHVDEVVKRGLIPNQAKRANAAAARDQPFSPNYANIRIVRRDCPVDDVLDVGEGINHMIVNLRTLGPSFQKVLSEAATRHGWDGSAPKEHDVNGLLQEHERMWPQKPISFVTDHFMLFCVADVLAKTSWARGIPSFGFMACPLPMFTDFDRMYLENKDNARQYWELPDPEMFPKKMSKEAIRELFQKMSESLDVNNTSMKFDKISPLFQTIVVRNGDAMQRSSGLLLDACRELDPQAVDRVNAENPGRPVVCVGPLCAWDMVVADRPTRSEGNPERTVVMEWLDRQEPRSVLYVSFGSASSLEDEQIVELERALASSGLPYLWSLRIKNQQPALTPGTQGLRKSADATYIEVPSSDSSRGGLIANWIPQREVLRHPAVGGYLTHSGWNSTQESMSAGIPMLTWPMFGDQHTNAKLINDLGVGVNMKDTFQFGRIVPADEIVDSIHTLMDPKRLPSGGKSFSKTAAELAQRVKEAVSPGGSSYTNWEKFPRYT